MLLVALIIGVVLIVAAIRGTQGTLFSALMQDVPAYVVWAAAIVGLGAIGYVPGLKPASRALLVLIFVVIVLHNYQKIIAGFQSVVTPPKAQTPVSNTIIPGGGSFGGAGATGVW